MSNVGQDCHALTASSARGTSEPNYADGGKFGVIVGDPVVSNTSAILPGARGYPVQVKPVSPRLLFSPKPAAFRPRKLQGDLTRPYFSCSTPPVPESSRASAKAPPT